jgi:hypothetical protein
MRRLFLLAIALFCAAPANAYVQSKNSSGVAMSWATHGHSFQIDAQWTGVTGAPSDAIRKSFATWAAVTCTDLTLPEEALSTDPKARLIGFFPNQTNHNLVLLRTRSCQTVAPAGDPCFASGGCDNLYDCFDENLKTGVLATTTTTSNSRTGEIIDTDTEFNGAPHADGSQFVFTALDGPPCAGPTDTGCVQFDIQNTMTHEAGHTLGLDHTLDPRATMYATAPSGEVTKRVLGQDDVAGICAIYPKGSGSSGGCGCSHAQTGPGAALCALLFLLQIRRRSSRKPQLAIKSSVASASAARFQGESEN